MRFVLLLSLLLFGACGSSLHTGADAKLNSASQTDGRSGVMHTREEVSALIRRIYLKVLDNNTLKYFAKYPDLDREHTRVMREFILSESSPEIFVAMMLGRWDESPDPDQAIPGYKRKSEFSDADMTAALDASDSMAEKIIFHFRGVYVAEFVDKNPIKLELFKMDWEKKFDDYIEAVGEEVTAEDFIGFFGDTYDDYVYREGDRFFYFCSSEESWDWLCGYEGFLIVRDGKILQAITTSWN